jgi:hypothetical protein
VQKYNISKHTLFLCSESGLPFSVITLTENVGIICHVFLLFSVLYLVNVLKLRLGLGMDQGSTQSWTPTWTGLNLMTWFTKKYIKY